MKIVHIYINSVNHVVTVNEKQYKTLLFLENYNGFNRFGLSLYDEGVRRKPVKQDYLNGLYKQVFTVNELTELFKTQRLTE